MFCMSSGLLDGHSRSGHQRLSLNFPWTCLLHERWMWVQPDVYVHLYEQEANTFVDAKVQDQCAETMMSNGCGFINLAALVIIARTLRSVCPVVVPGSFRWCEENMALASWPQPSRPKLATHDLDSRLTIQIKLGNPCKWDKSHLILDLVLLPRLTIPSRLYM